MLTHPRLRTGFRVAALLVSATVGFGQDDRRLPRLAGAELLEEAFQPDRLVLTGNNGTTTIQVDNEQWRFSPTISRHGTTIALVRRVTPNSKWSVSTYSVLDHRWSDFPQLTEMMWGSIAISPDASKIACVEHDHIGVPPRLVALNLMTGTVTPITELGQRPGPSVSWAPDGRSVVYELESDSVREIYVTDLGTGRASKIGSGLSPAWSPSGLWIAFVRRIDGRYSISTMTPDGTESRVLMSFRSDVIPMQPVWSPDSKFLLVNKSRDPDKGTFDICVLDINKRKCLKTFKSVAPVYGWVKANSITTTHNQVGSGIRDLSK